MQTGFHSDSKPGRQRHPVSLDDFLLNARLEFDLHSQDIFSCSGCELRQECTGHVSRIMVTTLLNALFYYFNHVFIIHINIDYFHLVVMDEEQVLVSASFPTLAAAKQAFMNRYGEQMDIHLMPPIWDSYFPCSDWLEEKMQALKSV